MDARVVRWAASAVLVLGIWVAISAALAQSEKPDFVGRLYGAGALLVGRPG